MKALRPALIALALGCALALTFGSGPQAQETELPGVSADSIHEDFLKTPEMAAPAAPGEVPPPPRVP